MGCYGVVLYHLSAMVKRDTVGMAAVTKEIHRHCRLYKNTGALNKCFFVGFF